jgi:hypothetical protein
MAKREIRFFNTTGPCNPDDHYMLPPEERLVGAQLHRYVKDELYWMLHAPRQTGKTTFLQSWMRELNAVGDVVACYVSVERAQSLDTIERAKPAICSAVCEYAESADLPIPEYHEVDSSSMLSAILRRWAALVAPRPLVVLFDEVDVMQGDALISFLRQLRDGFAGRGVGRFPTSIALVGMRDLRDYITTIKGGIAPNPGSPFNIKSDSALIGNFSRNDLARLFAQRTKETGQQIAQEALDYAWEQSKGQPWLVNSLFMRATLRILDEDSRETVTADHLRLAREQMIQARETHLDALGQRLHDPRVKHVVQTIITGDTDPNMGRTHPDVELAMDLGLIDWSSERGFAIANPVYEEILTRYLSSGYHDSMPPPSTWQWQKPDGTLDMDSLLREFQRFWRENSEMWERKADYTEAFPHLLLLAFLQRLTNGGGRVEREVSAGSGRMDLLVEYLRLRYIIEIKLIRDYDAPERVRSMGLEQVARYRDAKAPDAPAYLVIFDRRSEARLKPWGERITWTVEGGVVVAGC